MDELYCWLWTYWSCQSDNFNWIFWWDLFWWFSNMVLRPFKNHLEEAWAIFTRKIHCQSGDLSSWISLPSSAWMGHKKTAASLHFLVSVIWYQGFHKRGEKVLLLFWLGWRISTYMWVTVKDSRLGLKMWCFGLIGEHLDTTNVTQQCNIFCFFFFRGGKKCEIRGRWPRHPHCSHFRARAQWARRWT